MSIQRRARDRERSSPHRWATPTSSRWAGREGTPSQPDGVGLPDTFGGHLVSDLQHESTTPRFGWITPNLCDDGHDSTCAAPNTIGQHWTRRRRATWRRLPHWLRLLQALARLRPGSGSGSDADRRHVRRGQLGGRVTACCGEKPGPDNRTPGFSPLLTAIYHQYGLTIPNPAPGGGNVGAVLMNLRYVTAGSVDTTGDYNHYSPCAANRICSGSPAAARTASTISDSRHRPVCRRSAATCSTSRAGGAGHGTAIAKRQPPNPTHRTWWTCRRRESAGEPLGAQPVGPP